jgi:hypothetical protein
MMQDSKLGLIFLDMDRGQTLVENQCLLGTHMAY